MQQSCNSCKKPTTNMTGVTRFTCPGCNQQEIARCTHCKTAGTKYHCSCGFEGPN